MESTKTGPKDFFLYLSAMITLYVSVGSLFALLFGIIDFTNPDRLDFYGSFYTGGIRFAIASLLIIFPVYLIVTWVLRKSIIREPSRAELWVRKWFIYITLFVAAGIVIGNLVAVVNEFLGGEITIRFVLKVLSMLSISLGVFGYYWYDLRRTKNADKSDKKTFAVVAVLVVLAAVVGGLLVAGSPATQRDLRFDEERVEDLSNIQFQITEYWRVKEQLPESLDTLSDELRGFVIPADPETDESYEYRILSADTFELCATFTQPSVGRGEVRSVIGGPYNDFGTLQTFEHDAGRVCFERTIDPDFFPKPVR